MAQPIWTTLSDLGSFVAGTAVSILLIARPIQPAISVTYNIVTGSLPAGLTLDSTTGFITGTSTVIVTSTVTFIVIATDNLGNTTSRTFSIRMVYQPAQPVWNTATGSIGSYPSLIAMSYQLSASAVLPSTSIAYTLLSGTLPIGLSLSNLGLISGTPSLVTSNVTNAFSIRATDNLGNIRDRTFSLSISGSAIPQFTTPNGSLINTYPTGGTIDSVWVSIPITYSNPSIDNPVIVQLRDGVLPPGLEIDLLGTIRGYAKPPVINITNPTVNAIGLATSSVNNTITVISTGGFTIGRPIIFSGTTFSNIVADQEYYVKTITSSSTFTISETQNGDVFSLDTATGFMNVTLPATVTGTPTIRTYNFTLELSSPLGGDTGSYSITVVNQNTPTSQGGPGNTPNTRIPVILNARPLTYRLNDSDIYYGYYVSPPVAPSQNVFMGNFQSGNYFAFKIIGHDFDNNDITYEFTGLPTGLDGLTGNTQTGWITGTPALGIRGIESYNFGVSVYKTGNPDLEDPPTVFNFTYNLEKDITGRIIWISDSDLGQIFNGSLSNLAVKAESDVELEYALVSGEGVLPPNLTLSSDGEIIGRVADQPTSTLLEQGTSTEFTFTVEAYSPIYSAVVSYKTFTITVLQEFSQPTDTLYIQALPSINDRQILASLLDNEELIPSIALYRANDQYFGKATSVIYEHAYGIYASNIEEYILAVTRNHYWRNITLGELKTAVAKNDAGEIIYEVVYSEVIDNLVNPQGVSIQEEIYWPRPIDLGLGPWYTSITDIYTSYNELLPPGYYTSRTPGYARVLYPNSLYNMRNRVAQVLGQVTQSTLLPLWMTSQQSNGSTLGYTQAWVICYTKPNVSDLIKANIEANWPYTLNQINFQIDRFSVDKSATYSFDSITELWDELPGAVPTPDPLNSENFYVLFPRKTILPDDTQY